MRLDEPLAGLLGGGTWDYLADTVRLSSLTYTTLTASVFTTCLAGLATSAGWVAIELNPLFLAYGIT